MKRVTSGDAAASMPPAGRLSERLTGLPGGVRGGERLRRQLFPWWPCCWPSLQTADVPTATAGAGQGPEICLRRTGDRMKPSPQHFRHPQKKPCAHEQPLLTVPTPAPHIHIRGRTEQWRPVTLPSRGTADSRPGVLPPLSAPRVLPATLRPSGT